MAGLQLIHDQSKCGLEQMQWLWNSYLLIVECLGMVNGMIIWRIKTNVWKQTLKNKNSWHSNRTTHNTYTWLFLENTLKTNCFGVSKLLHFSNICLNRCFPFLISKLFPLVCQQWFSLLLNEVFNIQTSFPKCISKLFSNVCILHTTSVHIFRRVWKAPSPTQQTKTTIWCLW